jgi:putative phage-type endonuclease
MTRATLAPMRLLSAVDSGPHNPVWHELRRRTEHGWSITASEIAGVLGISPWQSPFSLYWSKRLDWHIDDNPYMRWGRLLESVIGDEFARTHTDLEVCACGLFANPEHPWQLATPDLSAIPNEGPAFPVQIKTDRTLDPNIWGPEFSDIIPVHYRAQVLWEIDVMRAEQGVLYVLPLDTREPRMYVIDRDERDLEIMRTRAEQFRVWLDSDTPPDLDDAVTTLSAVKRLHPDLEDRAVEIAPELADGYQRANALAKRIQRVQSAYEARVRQAMGAARYATVAGQRVASRSRYPHWKGQTIVDKLTETKGREKR